LRIDICDITKSYSSRNGATHALVSVKFEVDAGQFVCLLGPSGCGKSTLLNIIAGLDEPTAGQVKIDGRPVSGPGRDRVMIFQEAALFPWLNVQDNVEFGLRMAGMPATERRKTCQRLLALVKLSDFGKASVHELSGGMKQRVALARALALDPEVLLMDEPFGALDAQTRDLLHDELQDIWADTAKTVLFVTHNVREAIVLGDRVLVFSPSPGRIKKEFTIGLPRPRHIDDYRVVDQSHEIMAVLRNDTQAGEVEGESGLQRRADTQIERSLKLNFRQVGDDVL
jgi:NitT/TauT family transport system ATP-binding protein